MLSLIFAFIRGITTLKVKVKLDKESRSYLSRIATSLESIRADTKRIADSLGIIKLTYSIRLEGLMAVYKADKPDFDFRIILIGTDSEGHEIVDAPIPAGHSLLLTSDNPTAFSAVQDAADARLVHAHVGSPGQSNLVVNLFDGGGNLAATGGELVTVVAGDVTTIASITLALPPSDV